MRVRLKGGPGSGHRGHSGRPGRKGGSLPGIGGARNIESIWEMHSEELYGKIFGDMSKEDVENMFLLPGTQTDFNVSFSDTAYGTKAVVHGSWQTENGEKVAIFQRTFYVTKTGERIVHNDSLQFYSDFQNRGLATSLYDRQIGQLRKAGFDSIELDANISIGRYAWARKGFDYADPGRLDSVNLKFRRWARERFARSPAGGWPTFRSASEVASYKLPGVSFPGSSIRNTDVPADMSLSVGKAFMLDMSGKGHGAWSARLKL